jgi:hypothetical protein
MSVESNRQAFGAAGISNNNIASCMLHLVYLNEADSVACLLAISSFRYQILRVIRKLSPLPAADH